MVFTRLHFSVIPGILGVVLVAKSSDDWDIKGRVPQGSILGLTFSLLRVYDFLMMVSVILLSTLMIPISTLNVIKLLYLVTAEAFQCFET